MEKRTLLIYSAVMFLVAVISVGDIEAAEMMKMSPYMQEEKVKMMQEMMMSMQPDSLEASIKRGEKLFDDTRLGENTTGQSCNTCHPNGGTIGGAAEMMWKGQTMKVAIPTLKEAASHFPKAAGPMKVVTDVMGQNNMCIMVFLKGRPLDKNTQEAVDLAAYVTSFSKGLKMNPGGAKIVPTPVPGAM
ncbi:MAG: hypothetical protein HZA12_00580 [Nitrospirae bacterium]|nr:hypothetical protein [Nitrospirota bacterium]